jgi:hypothetical protein
MSWHHWQIAFSNVPRSPEDPAASSASLPPSSRAGAAEQPHFPHDLRRSLQMHRRLVLGIALFGLFLAAVCLLGLWAVNTARSLLYVQPTLSAMIHNAMLLQLGFAFLGVAVVIVARKSDPRIYVASDVERLVGFVPMAQLPDFSEVSDEVAKKHLMRLVARIDTAYTDRRVRNCVFTGTGPGAGATTVALRVKETFETLGRAAVVRHGTKALLDSVVEEVEGQPAEMVLTDTAPLTASAETEYLARHADCTIVVIQSGVTTRAQLRSIASLLERLHLPFVGFVLNRVRSAKADEAFRRSLEETERDLRLQNWSADRQMLRTLHFAVESGRASLERESAVAAHGATGSLAEIDSTAAPVEELDPAAVQPIPQAEPGAARAPQKPEPARSNAAPPDEAPWWLLETPARADTALTQPRMPRPGRLQVISSRSDGGELPHESVKPALDESTHVIPPRLSELRGMFFSAGLKELDRTRHAAQQSVEAELLMKAITPFEPQFNHTESASSSVPGYTPEVEAEHTVGARTLIPIPNPEIAPVATNEAGADNHGSRQVAKQREFHPSQVVALEKSGARRGRNGGQTQREQDRAMPEQSGVSDEVQILPSKRGQYKKNGWEQQNSRS